MKKDRLTTITLQFKTDDPLMNSIRMATKLGDYGSQQNYLKTLALNDIKKNHADVLGMFQKRAER